MRSIFRTISIVMILMVLSKIMALFSNYFSVTYYGVCLQMDIYSYAIQLPNIIFNSFGTSLMIILIPIFAKFIGTGDRDRAYRYADIIISLSVVFTILLAGLGIAIAPYILKLTRFSTEGFDFALYSLRIMFPIVVFYALSYILQGMLQSLGKYTMPSIVSAVSSTIIVAYIFIMGNRYGIKGLLITTFIALVFQAIILIPPIMAAGYRYKPQFKINNEDIRLALRLIPPVLIGTSAFQIKTFFNLTMLANYQNAVVIITMVQNLMLNVTLTFIYAITTVLFPKFAILIAQDRMVELSVSLRKTLSIILYVLIPLSFGILGVRFEIINLLMGWGKFNSENVRFASQALGVFSIGLAGLGIKEVIDRVFYSMNDTKTPAVNEVFIVIVNILLSLMLVKLIGVWAIPLGYSISYFLGGIISIFLINRKLSVFSIEWRSIKAVLQIVFSSIAMLLTERVIEVIIGGRVFVNPITDKTISLVLPFTIGIIIYFISTYFWGVGTAVEAAGRIKRCFLKG